MPNIRILAKAVLKIFCSQGCSYTKCLSFILFNELLRFLGEIETDNLTVSNSEIITFDFTVSNIRIFVK